MSDKKDRVSALGSLLASRNSLIRREAAQALAQFPLTNPQIPSLIRNSLQATTWETREAAAEALCSISKAVPINEKKIIPEYNRLSVLNLANLISDFHPLLSCEADLITRINTCVYGEQRKLVDQHLEFPTIAGISSESFLCVDDFLEQQDESIDEKWSGFKIAQNASSNAVFASKNVHHENVLKSDLDCETENTDQFEEVLHLLLLQLMQDIVNVKWEIRHGAALAFAVILAVIPNRLTPVIVDMLAVRLFQAIALDNFIDFSSGRTAIGPVREAVAECIARLITAYPCQEFMDAIFSQISSLHHIGFKKTKRCSSRIHEMTKKWWFQRQAALLIIKYHFAGPLYRVKFDEMFKLILDSFEESYDEVLAAALSAVTTLFCKENADYEIKDLWIRIEPILYRFINSACNSRNQLWDVDTVAVDLLTLLFIWLQGDQSRKLPYHVLGDLSRLLDPLHVTRSLKIVNVFTLSFSRRYLEIMDDADLFDECAMNVLTSLFRIVLFAAPSGADELIETCVLCVHRIVNFCFSVRIPPPLVQTIGRWSSCLLINVKNAEIDPEQCNIKTNGDTPAIECMCGDEIRALNDIERIDVLFTRKMLLARFLAPFFSVINNSPTMIGDQSSSEAVQFLVIPLLSSPIIMHRLAGTLLCHSWFTFNWLHNVSTNYPVFLADALKNMVLAPNALYDDENMYYIYLDNAYKEFSSYCCRKGVKQTDISDIEERGQAIDDNANAIYALCCESVCNDTDKEILDSRYEYFKSAVATAKAIMTSNISRVNALAVSSLLLINPRILMESQTLNPFVKPLMELIRFEENFVFAEHALNSFPMLFKITAEKNPNPHAKMMKQLVVNLTSCQIRLPDDIDSSNDSVTDSKKSTILSLIQKIDESARSHNAEYVIRMLVTPAANTDLATLLYPANRSSHEETLMFIIAYSIFFDEVGKQRLPSPSEIDQIINVLNSHLISDNPVTRCCAAHCLKNIARVDKLLKPVLSNTIQPLHAKTRTGEADINERCGLAELLLLMSELDIEVLGGLRILAPTSLRLMADNCPIVRECGALAFRNFVPLMTLRTHRKSSVKSEFENDKADENVVGCAIDLLLGDPSHLPEIGPEKIIGLNEHVVLRPYQQEGIRWLSFLEEYGLSGILADDMGLGKTLQTLCLLAIKLHDKPTAKVLIICPPTLVNHWCSEWSKYFPSLTKFHKVDESVRERECLMMKPSQMVTVVSYSTIRSCSYFLELDWYYIILDEGHVIRNPGTQLFKVITSLRSRNRLILSGTPIQNTPADLWSLFQFIMPGYLGSMKHFKLAFLNAINTSRNLNASTKEIKEGQNALEKLHKAVLPLIMRRIKTDVLQDLPAKMIQDYMCSLTPTQRYLYNHIVELCRKNFQKNQERYSALEIVAELRKCIVHPVLVSNKVLVSSNVGILQGSVEESGKLVALRDLLRECGIGTSEQNTTFDEPCLQESQVSAVSGHRALIFCQRISAVQLISKMFDSGKLGNEIRYAVLDGSIPVSERHAVAENFNVDPTIHVLILTTSVGGEGLNLTGADVVIFIEHDWNPIKDLQAMDRAHRIGQKSTVNVYRLITLDSIEQKIMRFQKFKTDTANALVGSDNRSLETMATEQLVEILSMETVSPTSSNYESPSSSNSDHSIGKSKKFWDAQEAFELEELWDMSQYERYNAANVVQSFVQSSSNGIKTSSAGGNMNVKKRLRLN